MDYRYYLNNPDSTSMQFISITIIILESSSAPGLDISLYSDDWIIPWSNREIRGIK